MSKGATGSISTLKNADKENAIIYDILENEQDAMSISSVQLKDFRNIILGLHKNTKMEAWAWEERLNYLCRHNSHMATFRRGKPFCWGLLSKPTHDKKDKKKMKNLIRALEKKEGGINDPIQILASLS